MIVKPSVNELLKNVENRYALVIAASKRAREISNGKEPLIETKEKSPVTIAANEIAEKKVYVKGEHEEETDASIEEQDEYDAQDAFSVQNDEIEEE